MCGEKWIRLLSTLQCGGSPPHVRGKVIHVDWYQFALGITPACAGKSRSGAGRGDQRKDHPRMCGEKTKKIP